MEILLVVDERRSALRDEIKSFMKMLVEDKGFLIGEVISEFLIASAISIKSDDIPVSIEYYTHEDNADGEEEDEEDEDFYFASVTLTPEEQQEQLEYREKMERQSVAHNEFYSLGITKKMAKHQESLEKFIAMKRHREAFDTEKSILQLSCEYAEEWFRLLSEFEGHSYYMPINLGDMCKTSASLLDSETIDVVNSTAQKLSSILGDKFFSYEVFNVEREQYVKDLSEMRSVYEYINQNPGCKQAKIYSELSLDGRRIGNLIEWAVKHGRMNRIRDKNTWLLYLNNGA